MNSKNMDNLIQDLHALCQNKLLGSSNIYNILIKHYNIQLSEYKAIELISNYKNSSNIGLEEVCKELLDNSRSSLAPVSGSSLPNHQFLNSTISNLTSPAKNLLKPPAITHMLNEVEVIYSDAISIELKNNFQTLLVIEHTGKIDIPKSNTNYLQLVDIFLKKIEEDIQPTFNVLPNKNIHILIDKNGIVENIITFKYINLSSNLLKNSYVCMWSNNCINLNNYNSKYINFKKLLDFYMSNYFNYKNQ